MNEETIKAVGRLDEIERELKGLDEAEAGLAVRRAELHAERKNLTASVRAAGWTRTRARRTATVAKRRTRKGAKAEEVAP
jgi:hypothetical protein